jgi:hypothetical protein
MTALPALNPDPLFMRSAGTDMLPIRMWQDVEGQLGARPDMRCDGHLL